MTRLIVMFARSVIVLMLIWGTAACSYIPWFGDEEEIEIEPREPAELTDFTPEITLQRNWAVSSDSDAEEKYVRLRPLFFADKIAFVGTRARISVYEIAQGKAVWSRTLSGTVTGGVGGNSQVLVVGTINGDVIAVNSNDGTDAWSAALSSEVMAISEAIDEVIVVRTNDSRVHGLSVLSGEVLWVVSQSSPALTLRGVGAPLVREGIAYVGLDNGKVIAISINSGNVIWESRVSVPSGRTELDRIVDVDGQIAADADFIYAASYHGRVAAIDRTNGRIVWARDLASISGLSIDEELVYISDRDDSVWALQKNSGVTKWRQDKLFYRELSAPVILGNTVLVGDFEGYLHIMAKEDGRLIGRDNLGKQPIQTSSSPSDAISYIVDTSGRLAAYSISSVN